MVAPNLLSTQSQRSTPLASPPSRRIAVKTTVAKASTSNSSPQPAGELLPSHDRRQALAATLCAVAATLASNPQRALAKGAATRTAGDFCPPSSKDGYVVYKPDARATPSIRAGVIPDDYYSFELPSTWREGTILNILSGNFCMPKCDEPWYESLWESSEEGTATLVVSPIYRLVSKSNATLKDLGTPEQVVEKVGAFITGNYLDSVEDVTAMSTEQFGDGKTYYVYELNAPYAKVGTRQLAALTVKGNLVYLWVLAATDKQWAKAEGTLRYMLKSFKA